MGTQVLIIILAYLTGAIPTAVWVGRWFYAIDVREYGSGNAGATNTFRVLGAKAGVPVLLFDVLKGFAAVHLVRITEFTPGTEPFVNLQLALGISALVGHIFPIYVGFRGGKGIATLLGFMLAVEPLASGLAMAVFIGVFVTSRIVSVSSIASAIAFPLIVNFYLISEVNSLRLFSIFIAILVLITHQKNIERLFRGEESRVNFSSKHNHEDNTEN